MARVVVDRIEGDRVILEVDGLPAEIAAADAPSALAEGTVWEVATWPTGPWTRLQADSSAAEALLARLRKATPQAGDIDL